MWFGPCLGIVRYTTCGLDHFHVLLLYSEYIMEKYLSGHTHI
jgi:hypothetical protein